MSTILIFKLVRSDNINEPTTNSSTYRHRSRVADQQSRRRQTRRSLGHHQRRQLPINPLRSRLRTS